MDGCRLLAGVVQVALLVGEAGVVTAVLRVVDLVEHIGVGEREVVEAQAAGQRGDQPDDDERLGVPPVVMEALDPVRRDRDFVELHGVGVGRFVDGRFGGALVPGVGHRPRISREPEEGGTVVVFGG